MILQQKYLCANKTCWYTNLNRGITNLVVTHMGYNLISFMFLYILLLIFTYVWVTTLFHSCFCILLLIFTEFLSCSFISISLTIEFLLNFPRCPCECLIEMKKLLGTIHMVFPSTGSNDNA